ncbi:uncharacterized protein [Centruroides vittatus]|uniref:uncharacterized protein n=1 Tax=Centruroides vittatus TaxID=120091 RepID=UPI00350EF3E3
MARLRFPGRPVQRRGRSWMKYHQEETSLSNEQPLKTANIERKWKLFYEIFGHSDEDEEFEGFPVQDEKTRNAVLNRRKELNSIDIYTDSSVFHIPVRKNKLLEYNSLSSTDIYQSTDTSKEQTFSSSLSQFQKDDTSKKYRTQNSISDNFSHQYKSRGTLSKTIARLKASADVAGRLVSCQRGELCTIPDCEIHNVSENGDHTNSACVETINTSVTKYLLNSKEKNSEIPLKKRTELYRENKEVNLSSTVIKEQAESEKYLLASSNSPVSSTAHQNFTNIVNQNESIVGKTLTLNSVSETKVDNNNSDNKCETSDMQKIDKKISSEMANAVNISELNECKNDHISVNSDEKTLSKRQVYNQSSDEHLPKKRKLKLNNAIITNETLNNINENTQSEKSYKNINPNENLLGESVSSSQSKVIDEIPVSKSNTEEQVEISSVNCTTPYCLSDSGRNSKLSSSCSIEELIKRKMVSRYADIMATKSKDKFYSENVKALSATKSENIIQFHKTGKLEKVASKIEKILKSQWEGRINTDSSIPTLFTSSSYKKNNQQCLFSQNRTRNILCKPRLQLNHQKLLDLHKPESVKKLNEQFKKCDGNTQSLVKFPFSTTKTKVAATPPPAPPPPPPPPPPAPTPPPPPPPKATKPAEEDTSGRKDRPGTAVDSTPVTQTGCVRFGQPGTITCAVCRQVKYYSHVQRRFRQFSCEPCGKFFARFVRNPRHYFCPNGGTCVIASTGSDSSENKWVTPSSRCKACWLKICLEKFVVPSHLQEQLVDFFPTLDASNASDSTVNNHITNQEGTKETTNKSKGNCNSVQETNCLMQSEKPAPVEIKQNSRAVCQKKIKRTKLVTKTENQKGKKCRKTKDKNLKDNTRCIRRGPRIKHVCRRAAVVLGIPKATFPTSKEKNVNQNQNTSLEQKQTNVESESEKQNSLPSESLPSNDLSCNDGKVKGILKSAQDLKDKDSNLETVNNNLQLDERKEKCHFSEENSEGQKLSTE